MVASDFINVIVQLLSQALVYVRWTLHPRAEDKPTLPRTSSRGEWRFQVVQKHTKKRSDIEQRIMPLDLCFTLSFNVEES